MQLWQTTYIRPKVCLLFSLVVNSIPFRPTKATFLCKNKCRAKNAKKGKKSPLTNSLLTPLTSVFVSWEEGLMQKTYFTLQKFRDICPNCSCLKSPQISFIIRISQLLHRLCEVLIKETEISIDFLNFCQQSHFLGFYFLQLATLVFICLENKRSYVLRWSWSRGRHAEHSVALWRAFTSEEAAHCQIQKASAHSFSCAFY